MALVAQTAGSKILRGEVTSDPSQSDAEARIKKALEEIPPDLRSRLQLIRDACKPRKVSFWAALLIIGWFIVWLIRAATR